MCAIYICAANDIPHALGQSIECAHLELATHQHPLDRVYLECGLLYSYITYIWYVEANRNANSFSLHRVCVSPAIDANGYIPEKAIRLINTRGTSKSEAQTFITSASLGLNVAVSTT